LKEVEKIILRLNKITTHVSVKITSDLVECLNTFVWTDNVIIKHFNIDNNYIEINCFSQKYITETIINNNLQILRCIFNTIVKYKTLHLYTAKQAVRLSEELVDDINKNKLTQKELQKLIEKL